MQSTIEKLDTVQVRRDLVYSNEDKIIQATLDQVPLSVLNSKDEYQLPSGQYVNFVMGASVVISNTTIDSANDGFILDVLPPNGVFIVSGDNSIQYIAKDQDKIVMEAAVSKLYKYDKISLADEEYYMNSTDKETTLLDYLDSSYNKQKSKGNENKDYELLLNDFRTLIQAPKKEKDNIKPISRRNCSKDKDIDLNEQIEKLQEENKALMEENLELKERFIKTRTIMVEKCSKIPFWGRKLVKTINNELGENQLLPPKAESGEED